MTSDPSPHPASGTTVDLAPDTADSGSATERHSTLGSATAASSGATPDTAGARSAAAGRPSVPPGLSRAASLRGPRAADPSLIDGFSDLVAGGGLCELAGRGRTSLALRAVRAAQAAGQPVAWVDGSGSFCPTTARVDLEALTFVRPQTRRRPVGDALFAADVLLRSRAFALLVLDMPARGGGLLSSWFRLARLAHRAGSQLLVLHDQPRRLTGSAAALALSVRLRPVEGPPWADLPPPELEVSVLRQRGPTDPGGP